jgi:hypothetical protein
MRCALGLRLGLATLAASLAVTSVTAAAGATGHVVPRAGFYAGGTTDQVVVAASRRQLRFLNLAVAPGRRCSGRLYGQFVTLSRAGRFYGRGRYDRDTHETFSGRFLTSKRAVGTVTRVRYGADGSVACRAVAHFDVHWRRPL